MSRCFHPFWVARLIWLLAATGACAALGVRVAAAPIAVRSPDGRHSIVLEGSGADDQQVRFSVNRDGRAVIDPSPLGPVLVGRGPLGDGARIADVRQGTIDERFLLPWGKSRDVVDRCSYAVVTLTTPAKISWEVELRAYDDGVAFRYRLIQQPELADFQVADEATQFRVAGTPTAHFNMLDSFTTSHESLYERKPIASIPSGKLLDMPLLLVWPDGQAAALTEARVRNFAGMYLERTADDESTLHGRLSPLPSHEGAAVVGRTPHESPWRVVLLADQAGKLLESNMLLCLNDPPASDFAWARPGKTTFHWWYGEFEDDYKPPISPGVYLNRHRAYIDFCARHNIAYHGVSGDGRSWYVQSEGDYANPTPDADVRAARPEIELPKILDYARQRGVGIRLWVHWKPLSVHLEEAFALYEQWGVTGLMVDFLDRDDQEMIDFTERMLDSAARHKLDVQIHGSSKFSGEQRTFPNLFNREGVLNLEYLKWGDLCTPAHNVNVAYTRALAGPVDFHLGGFRSVSRAEFHPRDRAPVVLGTRCHHLALYVVYENPMPMVADAPTAYEGQPGFEFIAEVPTTWDETRFVAGEPGEYVALARRRGDAWYLGGITNWTQREVDVPLAFLGSGEFEATLYVDGSLDEAHPNAISKTQEIVGSTHPLHVSMAPGGGFVAVVRPK